MAKRNAAVVGEVCLYGSIHAAGFLAAGNGLPKLLGDGEAVEGRGFTSTVFAACRALGYAFEAAGRDRCEPADVWVYEPTGQRRARTSLWWPTYFGKLEWEPAPQLTISVAEIEAAAAAQGNS